MNQPLVTPTGTSSLATITSQLDYILLDGSGSMIGDRWWAALSAIDAYVAGLKAGHVQSHIILHTFCTIDRDLVQRDQPLADWRPLSEEPIGSHWGQTPLYDAIQLMARRIRERAPASRGAITIATDGGENGSTFTSQHQAKSLLDWLRGKGWQVTFIGAEFGNDSLARSLGGRSNEAIGVQQSLLPDAARALAEKRVRHARTGAPMHWTADEQQQFGGYLAGPSA